jgi:nucleotidyltransferase substrate binding protein (TIGR01987 family)
MKKTSRANLRIQSLQKASKQLDDAVKMPVRSELERAGLIQIFEYTFELAWKSLKDRLAGLGFDPTSPRGVIRDAFSATILSEADTTTMLEALGDRNLLAHSYDEALAAEAERLIVERYAPLLFEISAIATTWHDDA